MNKNFVMVTVGVLCAIVLLLGINNYANYVSTTKSKTILLTVDLQVAKQELVLASIADITRQNGADEIIEKIVVDCSAGERQAFDGLLDRLSGAMTATELRELDTLFYKCGRFFADRKAVMAARLYREVGVYSDYVALRSSIASPSEEATTKVTTWQQIADAELTMADYFNQLVRLQGDIITALINGKTQDSEEITTTLAFVTTIRGQMAVLTRQIENMRNLVLPI